MTYAYVSTLMHVLVDVLKDAFVCTQMYVCVYVYMHIYILYIRTYIGWGLSEYVTV